MNVRFAAVLFVCISAANLRGDVRLAGLFSDGVVLQRHQPVPLWGTADPGETVSVEFDGQTRTVVADRGGYWMLKLDPMKASETPRTLAVRGRNLVQVKDVLVGEVWLFSGQSNMAYLMSNMAQPNARDKVSSEVAGKAISGASDGLLREFRVDTRPADRVRQDVPTRTGWMPWTRKHAGSWAAMAAFFGKRLRESLDVPVGIVMCAWGGSGCSAWISAETLRSPELRPLWPEDVPGWRFNLAPSRLYNGMLRPVAPFAIAGFGWYQGETEATPYHNPYVYRHLFAAMIQDWRRTWDRPEIPFYFVQLPNRDNEPRWVVARESQAAALSLPRTGMVTALDIGQSWDLHPKNKHEVANRLADLILGQEYGRRTWPGSASFSRIAREPGALRVHFSDAAAGLKTNDGAAPREFVVAGEDRNFVAAEARIEGASVLVRAASVPSPVAVRYAWSPAPSVNLAHAGGVPVPPFRSDDWPVDGQEAMPQSLPVKSTLPMQAKGAAFAAGKAEGWRASEHFGALGETAALVLPAASGSIQVRGFPVREGAHPSPALYWTAEPALDAAKGVTFEVRANVTRIGNPDRGLDLEAVLRRPDGSFRRYLLSVFPSRLHTYQNNPAPRNSRATETRVLRTDLDFQPAVYRIAIRPDGVAQIYYDSEVVGTTSGETLSGDAALQPHLRVGKTLATGEWMANLYSVAYDTSGAFAPDRASGLAERAQAGEPTL